jgi:hypothetical protein
MMAARASSSVHAVSDSMSFLSMTSLFIAVSLLKVQLRFARLAHPRVFELSRHGLFKEDVVVDARSIVFGAEITRHSRTPP